MASAVPQGDKPRRLSERTRNHGSSVPIASYTKRGQYNGEILTSTQRDSCGTSPPNQRHRVGTDNIPLLDLVTVHRELREELLSVFETALDTAGFIGGPGVGDS